MNNYNYNEYEIEELTKCMDPVTGPEYFISKYFHVQHPIKGQVLFNPYGFQKDLIDTYVENKFSINLISRQMGKTATGVGYILWYAMFNTDRTILIGSHNLNSATEILQRILYAYDMLPDFLRTELNARNKQELSFENGCRILVRAVTPGLVRGTAISLLYLDEFSYVKEGAACDAWMSIQPALDGSIGSVIINSSFNDQSNYFDVIWNDACHLRNNFMPLDVTWHSHPDHRNPVWATQTKEIIGEKRFSVEYENRVG